MGPKARKEKATMRVRKASMGRKAKDNSMVMRRASKSTIKNNTEIAFLRFEPDYRQLKYLLDSTVNIDI